MAKKKKPPEPAIRKSYLITGGIAIGAALLGFVVVNFAMAGDGGGSDEATELAITDAASIPLQAEPEVGADTSGGANELSEGGRDPFSPAVVDRSGGSSGSSPSTSSQFSPQPPAPVQAVQPAPEPQQEPAATQPTYTQPQPVGEGPPPAAESQVQPQPTPAPAPASISALSVYGDAADVQIDGVVYEGVRAGDELTARFNLDEVKGECFVMKDMAYGTPGHHPRFTLCEGDVVQR
jgi:hypothetical protein